jgi:hypothetical protein
VRVHRHEGAARLHHGESSSVAEVLFWLMRRLRPNSVSTGSTLRQLLCTLQSPQPSQTSLVDDDTLVRVDQLAALAAAALLGGAGLVVDDHRWCL